MARELNPKVKPGDRISLINMEGEISVSPLTSGTVTKVVDDPFEKGEVIISVKWDTGSTLSLLSATDSWIAERTSKMNESTNSPEYDFFVKNKDVFDNFDWRFFREYLTKIRESSVINMFGASPLLYAGREHIDRYYGENPPNQEAFDEVLDMADTAKDKIVEGTVKYLKSKNKEISVEGVQSAAPKFARKLTELYMIFPQMER